MRALAVSAALVLCALGLADVYQVKHRRPSAILGVMAGKPYERVKAITNKESALVMPDMTLTANDSESTIDITGPKEHVGDAIRILQEFDIQARQIKVIITINSKADKYESVVTTKLNNNALWSFKDDTSGVEMKLKPRINNDGTITLASDVGGQELVWRTPVKADSTLGLVNDKFSFILTDAMSKAQPDTKNGKAWKAADTLITIRLEAE